MSAACGVCPAASQPLPLCRLLPTPFPLLCGCHHRVQAYAKSVRVAMQAWRAGPNSRVSKAQLEELAAEAKHRVFIEESQARTAKLLLNRKERERQQRLAAQRSTAPHAQPQKKAAAPRPAPVEWPAVAADAMPGMTCSRQAAAAASAAAAAAWAATAAGREAAAEAAAERAASQPAGKHTAGAEEWEWAAAAWHAAHQALDAARQACPDAPVVLEADAAVQAAHALKAQRQVWRGS